MSKNKKNKPLRFFLLLFLVFIMVYSGIKGGEYLAQKLTKPIDIDEIGNPLQGAKSSGESGKDYIISEDDKLLITVIITEFISAEHMKNADILTNLTDSSYYSTLLKSLKSISTAEAAVQDINFEEVSKNKIIIKVTYFKNAKSYNEVLILGLYNKSWKVSKVERL